MIVKTSGIVKVDLLGLGMMSVVENTLELCRERGRPLGYWLTFRWMTRQRMKMMQKAYCPSECVQIESRAQMATLPRLQPTMFL